MQKEDITVVSRKISKSYCEVKEKYPEFPGQSWFKVFCIPVNTCIRKKVWSLSGIDSSLRKIMGCAWSWLRKKSWSNTRWINTYKLKSIVLDRVRPNPTVMIYVSYCYDPCYHLPLNRHNSFKYYCIIYFQKCIVMRKNVKQ